MLYNVCIREHTSLLTGYTLAGLLKRFILLLLQSYLIQHGRNLESHLPSTEGFPFYNTKKNSL